MKAYLVRSKEYQWVRPYLFYSEATEIAILMTVASGIVHWAIETEVIDSLNALVRYMGKDLIVSIWNIDAVEDGFEADTVIDGRLYRVQHRFPFEPWNIRQPEKEASTFHPSSRQSSAWSETKLREISPSGSQTLGPAEDEAEIAEKNRER